MRSPMQQILRALAALAFSGFALGCVSLPQKLVDEDRSVRRKAAIAILEEDDGDIALSDDDIQYLHRALRTNRLEHDEASSLAALKCVRILGKEEFIEDVVWYIIDSHESVRNEATAIVKGYGATAKKSLLTFLGPQNVGTAVYAFPLVRDFLDESDIPRISHLIADKDQRTREDAIAFLSRFGVSAKRAFLTGLKSEYPDTRFSCLSHLVGMLEGTEIDYLVPLIADESDEIVEMALDQLSSMGSGTKEPLRKTLDIGSSKARCNALKLFADLADESDIPDLLKMFDDESPEVRDEAANVLASIGPAALDSLSDFLSMTISENNPFPVAWTVDVGDSIGQKYPSFRVRSVDDGKLYSDTSDGYVFAFDSGTGELIWKDKIEAKSSGNSYVVIKGLNGGRLLRANGNRLFSTDIYAGKALWDISIEDPIAQVAVIGDILIVGTGAASLLAISAENGATLWKKSLQSDAKPIDDLRIGESGRAFVLIRERLICVDSKNGGILWEGKLPTSSSDKKGELAVGGGMVFARNAPNPGEGDQIFAFDQRSGRNWCSKKDYKEKSVPIANETSACMIYGDYVFAVRTSTGKGLWQVNVRDGSNLSATGNVVYVDSKDGIILCIERASGKILWRSEEKYQKNSRGPLKTTHKEATLI